MNKFKAIILGAMFCGMLTLVTRVPLGAEPDHSAIRLSWRYVGAKVEKVLSQAELEELPIHMRPTDGVSESRMVSYRLLVELDGNKVSEELVHPGGLSEDRPLFVFREFPVPPGQHRVVVRFEPDSDEVSEEPFTFDQEVELELGQIVTVRLEEHGRGPALSL